MANTKYQPRITLDITREQAEALKQIPWGLKKPLFDAVIDDLITALQTNKIGYVIGAIVSREVHFELKQNDGNNQRPQTESQ